MTIRETCSRDPAYYNLDFLDELFFSFQLSGSSGGCDPKEDEYLQHRSPWVQFFHVDTHMIPSKIAYALSGAYTGGYLYISTITSTSTENTMVCRNEFFAFNPISHGEEICSLRYITGKRKNWLGPEVLSGPGSGIPIARDKNRDKARLEGIFP